MSRNDALWADRLLVDVREQADPTAADVARNLLSLERRLQLAAPAGVEGGAGPGTSAAAGSLLQVRPAATRAALAAAPLAASASGWKSAALLGRWLAFGATTALLGYLGGRAESQWELAEQEQRHARALELERGRQRELAQQQPEPTEVLPRPVPVPPVPEQIKTEKALEPARQARVPRAARAPQPAALAKAPAPNQQLRDAIDLLRRAEAELREGDAFAASLLLSDLERTVPPALLREERLATQALVACALGELQPARQALHELEQLNPESIYRARLEGSCADKTRSAVSKDTASPH